MDKYQETFELYDKIAEAYQDYFMDMDWYDATYDAFCQRVTSPNAKILEIGCGPGNITRYLLRKRPDFQILGIDMAPNMLRLARVHNPTAVFEVMDCRDIHQLNGTFEGVVCGFCMPYLSKEDCEKLIKDSASLLEEGGTIYLSVIEGDYSLSDYEYDSKGINKVFVYFHQADYLEAMLQATGFKNISCTRIAYTKANGVKSTHLVMMGEFSR